MNAVAQRPLDWCDAEWLARALAALPTRKSDGKPIIWGACEPATCLKNQPTVEQLARTTGSVPVLINKRPERADSHADRWYRQAMVLARRYGAQVTATIYPLQFYFFRHIAKEPQAWHGKPGTEVKYPAVGVCLNYRSRVLEEDLRRMRHALQAARQAGLKVDYFHVDLEYVVGSQSKALAQRRAVYQRCERCGGLAGHDRALLALRREMSAIIREVYPAAKQAWYNLGWTMRRGRLIPCASITQFWPQDLEVAEIASPSFYFGGDEPAYYQALPEVLSKILPGKGLAPIISTCFADYPRADWQDWDPRVTARVVSSYLADPRLPAIVVFPSLLSRSESVPTRHLIASRHLYAVAWAASRR